MITAKQRILIFEENPTDPYKGKAYLYDLYGGLIALRHWKKPGNGQVVICETHDGEIAMANLIPNSSYTIYKFNFFNERVDSVVVWASHFPPPPIYLTAAKLLPSDDGGFLMFRKNEVAGAVWLEKIYKNGEIEFVWQAGIDHATKIQLDELPGRGYVVSAERLAPREELPYFKQFFINKNGKLKSTNEITGFSAADISNPSFVPGFTFRTWHTAWQTDAFGMNFLTVHFPADSLETEPDRLLVFPNPSPDLQFAIRSPGSGKVRVEVFSAAGQRLFFQNFQKTVEFETFFWAQPDLPAGVYFVRAAVGGERFVGRWVKI